MPPRSLITIDGLPINTDDHVTRPFDYEQIFYIDIPTSKWNNRVLYHVFKQLGVKNLNDFIWDPTECNSMYVIKGGIVYKTFANLNHIQNSPNIYHPDFDPKYSGQNDVFRLNGLQKSAVIAGIDNWIQMETYNGQIFNDEALTLDKNNTTIINALVEGFAAYCRALNLNTVTSKANTITSIADSTKEKHNWVCYINKETGKKCTSKTVGETFIHSSDDAFRYITINVKDEEVYIDVCTSFTKTCEDKKCISVGRRHGVGYQLISYPENAAVQGFKHCPGNCMTCKKMINRYDAHDDIPDFSKGFAYPTRVISSQRHECDMDGIEHTDIKCVGGMTRYITDSIYPAYNVSSTIHESDLKSGKKSIYNNAEGSSEASKNNSKTKTQQIMATTKSTGLFDRMMAKYMAQYKPEKISGLAMTMDGNIALPNGQDEFIAIVDDHLENYPAEAVIQDIPFYSVQRPLNQVKVGDYVFLSNTAEGRKLAKVTYVNRTKDGQPKGLTVLRFSGAKDETAAITDKLTGLTTVEVVVNMLEGFQFPGMENGQSNPLMTMALMKECMGDKTDSGDSFEKLMMMSMFMGGGLKLPGMTFPGMGNGQQNPLMTMMLLKDFMGGKSADGLEKFMMMSMFMGGNNPFTAMNQAPAEQAPTRKTRSDKGVSRKPADDGADTTAGKEENAEQ